MTAAMLAKKKGGRKAVIRMLTGDKAVADSQPPPPSGAAPSGAVPSNPEPPQSATEDPSAELLLEKRATTQTRSAASTEAETMVDPADSSAAPTPVPANGALQAKPAPKLGTPKPARRKPPKPRLAAPAPKFGDAYLPTSLEFAPPTPKFSEQLRRKAGPKAEASTAPRSRTLAKAPITSSAEPRPVPAPSRRRAPAAGKRPASTKASSASWSPAGWDAMDANQRREAIASEVRSRRLDVKNMTKAAVDAAFDRIDYNGNGGLSLAEIDKGGGGAVPRASTTSRR